jgi:SAM-dependent methyltransferase
VLHHLDLSQAARELYRVLKPGGLAVFLDPFGENRLLEWARHCPLRSPNHRHTADETSLLYSDIETLRSVFEGVTLRELGLFTAIKCIFRKIKVGMIAIPRWERMLDWLARLDRWLLARLPGLRPLAQYVVVCVVKPAAENCDPLSRALHLGWSPESRP